MYKLKNVAKRGSAFLGAVGLLAGIGSSALPAFASADALNPLTERSLTLSSSSPGWAYTDGSGDSTYAPPNSGANGQKTGNYFSFKVSTDSTPSGTGDPITAMTFQYCTKSAGDCASPGNDVSEPGGVDDSSHTDLNIDYHSLTATEVGDDTHTGTITLASGSPNVTGAGTHFKTELTPGSIIVTAGDNSYVVQSITSDTDLRLTANATADEDGGGSGVTYTTDGFDTVVDTTSGLVKAVPGYANENPKYLASGDTGDAAEAARYVSGNFIVMYDDGGTWTESTGWTVSTSNQEDVGADDPLTGAQNTIILQNSTGLGLPAATQVKVLFFATSTDYITNPGAGYFFVKINTFKDFPALSDSAPINTLRDNLDPDLGDVIDGGVTVANVMNQSIQITTKVLETMEFSVGTVDPDTLSSTDAADLDHTSTFEAAEGDESPTDRGKTSHIPHTSCDTILTGMLPSDPQNVLQLGDQGAESSLATDTTYATHSYWRLSSNSSAGATVYYSGHTLSNTSGDEIAPIGTTAKASATGSEQFGLALDTTAYAGGNGFDDATYGVDYRTTGDNTENGADNDAAGVIAANAGDPIDGTDDSVLTDLGATGSPPSIFTGLNQSFHLPKLNPLVPMDGAGGAGGPTNYGGGSGTITNAGTAEFAFDPMSDTVPAAIATENNQVVDCVTGKMRYIANTAATTPAGIYTTKINYIAAPQY